MLKPKIKPQPYLRNNQKQLLRQEWWNIEGQNRDARGEEGNVAKSIREDARRNDLAPAKALCKEIFTKGIADRLHENMAETAQMNSFSTQLGESVVIGRTSQITKNAEVIKLVNSLLKAPEVAATVDHSSTKHLHVRLADIAKSSKLFDACSYIEPENRAKLFISHPAAYNNLMKAFSRVGKVDEVLRLFYRMKEAHCNPNVLCFNTVLNCLVMTKCFKEVSGVLDEMLYLGIDPNVSTYNILVKLYSCYLDQFEAACHILDLMSKRGHKPDVTTYSTLIAGLSRAGRVDDAYSVIVTMLDDNCYPNVCTYTPILQGLSVQGKIREAKEIIELMWKSGCPPNSVAYNILINALCRVENFDEVESLLKESELKGWQLNATSHFIYINGLCKAGKLLKAYGQLEAENLGWDVSSVSYNTVMNSFCKIDEWLTVLKLLGDMLKKSIVPDTRTYNIVVHSLCKAGKLRRAKSMVRSRIFAVDVVTYNTLINGYYKIGELSEVKYLYYKMTTVEKIHPDIFTYTIMIVMLCKQGEVSEAKYYFEESLRKGFMPDLVVYSAMINGCFKNGKLGEGLELLDRMLRQGLVPNFVVYDSILRAYCREGFCCSRYISHVCITIEKMLGKR